jgi:hypothetical protein
MEGLTDRLIDVQTGKLVYEQTYRQINLRIVRWTVRKKWIDIQQIER